MLFREQLLFIVRIIRDTQIQSVGRMQRLNCVKAGGTYSEHWAAKGWYPNPVLMSNQDLRNLYSSQNISRMTWVGHVACMRGKSSAYIDFARITWKRKLGRTTRKLEDEKMNHKEIELKCVVDWSGSAYRPVMGCCERGFHTMLAVS
jgi:hypothetical protein